MITILANGKILKYKENPYNYRLPYNNNSYSQYNSLFAYTDLYTTQLEPINYFNDNHENKIYNYSLFGQRTFPGPNHPG